MGRAAAFSFYPGKNLGAFGDAGALATGDEGLAEEVRALREHGQRAKYSHDREGYTARLDAIQAVVLLKKLAFLDEWNEERSAIASHYLEELADVGDLELPPVAPGSSPVWHLFVVRTRDPLALAAFLHDRGIATGRHYPEPVHLTGAYSWLGHGRGSFPRAERHAERVLSLPIFPGMSLEQADAVTTAVRDSSTVAELPANDAPYRLITNVDFGAGVVVGPFTNLYGCRIGDGTRVGPFVEIQRERRSVRAARSRATVHLRGGGDRGRGVRRTRRRLRQRQAPARDERRGRAPDSETTGTCSVRSSNAGRRSAPEPSCSAVSASGRGRRSVRAPS